ncbi:TNT domain-containing protein [Arthrobacter sp. ISL-48]|uniref:TNT domain-containing protein n=1 Tax=Arthrobacter sp. ISL-48 TaxID=2819110 RepID=UPI001BE7C00B|nr:TNT domain-containing protein [Arthrobacter sp. ISL-48]MBT2533898.1 TNT domain-containing protein [Arthrobacter sp. ISL-48]
MRIVVNTSAYEQASAELSSAQVFVRQALDGLSSGLAGAHQMAGNDDAGAKFANDYDEAAQNLVSGITDAVTGAGVLAKLLADTANVWSDAEHYASGGIAPLGLAACTADTSDLSGTCSLVSPTALGGRSDFVPEGWEWVQSVVGAVWPNGDAGKLRSARTAWQRAGDDLSSAAGKVDAASTALGGLVTPELSLVQAKLEQYRGYLNDLSTSSHALGQGCTEYADGIEEAHAAIIRELQELLITTVAVEVGAAVLAAFTFGASEVVGNAALMARIGLTGTRVAAMIARLVEVAATVGARMAGITGTITRTVGMLREIKVVKALTYLGTKAPAPIRAMTGIAFNSGVSVGMDAAMHGGVPTNIAHDILLGGISTVGVGAAVNSFKAGTRAGLARDVVAGTSKMSKTIAGQRVANAAAKVEELDSIGIVHYGPSGATMSTRDLVHPRADLANNNYPGQRPKPGLTADSPLVQRQIPEDFRMWDGKTRQEYTQKYADGTYPNGAPRIRSDAWPDDQQHPEGFLTPESRVPVVLQPGHLIDRYGLPDGRFSSPVGENFPDRGLPDFSLEKFDPQDGYHQYEVLHDVPAWGGPAGPAIDKRGGAVQYYTNLTIRELLAKGFIREVTP